MSNKLRLDQLLVERGLAESRTKAQALIMAGQVKVDGKPATKSGAPTSTDSELEMLDGNKYVSRAGLKLESVAEDFGLNFEGKTILDVGSSTGGFTDYALQNGAMKVYAVDVGTNQLAYKLRSDNRVTVMEQTDIRRAELPEQVDIIVMDVSFISLRKVLEHAAKWLNPGGQVVAMAKPQFEASKEIADRYRGVIKDEKTRFGILNELEAWIQDRFEIIKAQDSAVTGVEGNLERFYLLKPRP